MNKYDILINKLHPITKKLPFKLVDAYSEYKKELKLEKKTYENYKRLRRYMEKNHYDMEIESGYRSSSYQEKLFNDLVAKKGLEYATNHIALKNTSEHESGLAIDICFKIDETYVIEYDIPTKYYNILHSICSRYGFIIRYPKDKEDITGYSYEPWHIRYVGRRLAKKLTKHNITLEEWTDICQK